MNDITIDKNGNIILNDYRDNKPNYLKRGDKLCVIGRCGNMNVHDFHNPIWENIDTSFDIGYIDYERSPDFIGDIYDALVGACVKNTIIKKYNPIESYSINDAVNVIRKMKREIPHDVSTASIIGYWENPVIYKNEYVEIRKKDLMICLSYIHAKLKNDSKYN